jgi:excisionase family DNA binding protein
MEYLSPLELANLLKVRPGTIYSWISRRVDIPHVKIAGTLRFRRDSIESWLLQKEKDRKKRNFEL